MFKRAVITDEISQDFDRAVGIARRFRLDGVELRSAWDKNPHELDRSELGKVVALVREAGMAVPCISAPVFKCLLREDREYREHVEILRRSIAVAQELGARLVRGFTFWEAGDFAENLEEIAARIATVEPLLRRNDIVLVIESDPATFANSNEKLARVLTLIASDHIRALWDPGNNLYVAGAGRPYPEGYELVKPYLAHVHVKDVRRDSVTGVYDACMLGAGEVGFRDVFKRLALDGYDGWLSLETHYRLRGPLSDELLALPKGSAFSLGGEEATVESLENWEKLLEAEGLSE